ncbi:hypothetical protein [Rhizobium sp. Root708]|uniref:hypothetical protein n=1 Tax=Rhizobium sp. Root708 TaxID=1736592 RepID=UPI0012E3DB0B|nr:hypothetical protein [Rhizobium sp. Root708]
MNHFTPVRLLFYVLSVRAGSRNFHRRREAKSMLALGFPGELQNDIVGRIGEGHCNFGSLPASLLSIADKFEKHGLEFGPTGLHSLV